MLQPQGPSGGLIANMLEKQEQEDNNPQQHCVFSMTLPSGPGQTASFMVAQLPYSDQNVTLSQSSSDEARQRSLIMIKQQTCNREVPHNKC